MRPRSSSFNNFKRPKLPTPNNAEPLECKKKKLRHIHSMTIDLGINVKLNKKDAVSNRLRITDLSSNEKTPNAGSIRDDSEISPKKYSPKRRMSSVN